MATFLPSNLTVLVQSASPSLDCPIFGNGVGTKGAGGPGILQTFGRVAGDLSPLPSVTGVLGGFTLIVDISWSLIPLAYEAVQRYADRLPNSSTVMTLALWHNLVDSMLPQDK